MNRLENKVAIITRAGCGMGAVEAKLFAQEGAKVLYTASKGGSRMLSKGADVEFAKDKSSLWQTH